MSILANDIFNYIIEFITPKIVYENIFIKELTKQKEELKNIILISKILYNINIKQYIDAKTIVQLLNKYHRYQSDHESYLRCPGEDTNRSSPILLDMLFSGCNLPFADRTFDYYHDSIFEDIKKVISIMPSALNSDYGRLRCRYGVTPLHAACVNIHVPTEVVKYLVEKGADTGKKISYNGHPISILDDLEDNINSISTCRINRIKKIFN